MHSKAMFETSKKRRKGRPSIGGTKIRGERRHSLIFSKARWQSSFKTVGWFFHRRRNIGLLMSISLEMKRMIYYNLPRKPLISLSVLWASMSSTALIFSGLTSIPRSLTMCPSNFPEVTLKVHFLGFNLILKRLILSKNSVRLLSDLPCLRTSLSHRPHIPRHLGASCHGIE